MSLLWGVSYTALTLWAFALLLLPFTLGGRNESLRFGEIVVDRFNQIAGGAFLDPLILRPDQPIEHLELARDQMGQVPLLTREQEVEISKRIEDAEIEVTGDVV